MDGRLHSAFTLQTASADHSSGCHGDTGLNHIRAFSLPAASRLPCCTVVACSMHCLLAVSGRTDLP